MNNALEEITSVFQRHNLFPIKITQQNDFTLVVECPEGTDLSNTIIGYDNGSNKLDATISEDILRLTEQFPVIRFTNVTVNVNVNAQHMLYADDHCTSGALTTESFFHKNVKELDTAPASILFNNGNTQWPIPTYYVRLNDSKAALERLKSTDGFEYLNGLDLHYLHLLTNHGRSMRGHLQEKGDNNLTQAVYDLCPADQKLEINWANRNQAVILRNHFHGHHNPVQGIPSAEISEIDAQRGSPLRTLDLRPSEIEKTQKAYNPSSNVIDITRISR